MATSLTEESHITRPVAIRLVKYYFSQYEIDCMVSGVHQGGSVHICKDVVLTLSRIRNEVKLLFTIWNTNRNPLRFDLTPTELR